MTATTTLPERLARLRVNAALATISGDDPDMDLVSAAATLEAAGDLLGDALSLARWVVVVGEAGGTVNGSAFAPGLLEMARAVVRRADEAVRGTAGAGGGGS